MGFELGGFAFNDRDIDGTEKDREYWCKKMSRTQRKENGTLSEMRRFG